MIIGEIEVLRWLHILAMVYWLGGEWGVFQTSYNVVNPRLSLDERRRHMETAYRIDILARTGIILLLPLGLHMGTLYGFVPWDSFWLVPMWVVFIAWLSLTWAAFFQRETDLGIRLTKIDEALRYILIPALLIVGVASLLGKGPLAVGEGTLWYPAKRSRAEARNRYRSRPGLCLLDRHRVGGVPRGRQAVLTDQCGSSPPETFRLSAVMYLASSEHRKATASAVSWGRPGRRIGMRLAIACR